VSCGTQDTIEWYTQKEIRIKGQFVGRKDMDVKEHEILFNITLVNAQFVLIEDMDVKEHETLFNITLVNAQLIYIHVRSYYKLFLSLHLCLSVMFDSVL
jgi:hypothetical protein